MASYNKVILMGNLTRDPQTGTLPNSGTALCEFGLAVNRIWTDAGGNKQEEVLFIDCTAFGRVAETLGQYLAKGRPIHIEGRLKLDRWEQDGQPRSKVRVIVEQFRFVDANRDTAPRRKESTKPDARSASPAERPIRDPKATKGRSSRRAAEPQPATAGAGKGDDIPF